MRHGLPRQLLRVAGTLGGRSPDLGHASSAIDALEVVPSGDLLHNDIPCTRHCERGSGRRSQRKLRTSITIA